MTQSSFSIMDDENGSEQEDNYVDWRGKEADLERHGGFKAASFTFGVEILENMVFLSNANNFISYFIKSMHYPLAKAANMVTNFLGTSFLLTIFGGFVSDSYFTKFSSFFFFCVLELLALILLLIQAQVKTLQPADGHTPSKGQAAILFTALYAMAMGVGGIKATLPAHGADQINKKNKSLISVYFNWYFFSLCMGGLLASTVMVWIQENRGWTLSFKISTILLTLALCIFVSGFQMYRYKLPGGSPFARLFKVIACAFSNRNGSFDNQNVRFLDKALVDLTITKNEVEETRTFLRLLPIFLSTIMMNCCLAQLQTFSVKQGDLMNKKFISRSFKIPTQSLTVMPLIVMLSSIPLYERFVRGFGSKLSIVAQPLKRIGIGLALASIAMAVAASIEVKRRSASIHDVKISVFWLGFQYLFLGVSDMLTLGGMLEFFYSEAPETLKSTSTALSWCSTSMGFFLSSVLVNITNGISGKYGRKWFGAPSLDGDRLELFYVLLCVLNFINLLNYVFWARRY